MRTVKLITCETLIEAHFIKVRLNNEGIECFLTNQNFTNLMPLFNNMLGSGIQVIINETELEKASKIIKDKLKPDIAEMTCSYCGSTNIRLGIGERKGLKIINMLIALILWLPMGNLRPKYYCRNCKKEIE